VGFSPEAIRSPAASGLIPPSPRFAASSGLLLLADAASSAGGAGAGRGASDDDDDDEDDEDDEDDDGSDVIVADGDEVFPTAVAATAVAVDATALGNGAAGKAKGGKTTGDGKTSKGAGSVKGKSSGKGAKVALPDAGEGEHSGTHDEEGDDDTPPFSEPNLRSRIWFAVSAEWLTFVKAMKAKKARESKAGAGAMAADVKVPDSALQRRRKKGGGRGGGSGGGGSAVMRVGRPPKPPEPWILKLHDDICRFLMIKVVSMYDDLPDDGVGIVRKPYYGAGQDVWPNIAGHLNALLAVLFSDNIGTKLPTYSGPALSEYVSCSISNLLLATLGRGGCHHSSFFFH
jgi:hypothetical protein